MSFRPRQPRVRDRAYLDWIKQLPCLACAVEGRITYGVDPAHIRHAFGDWRPVGKAEKPDDHRCVPLCRMHHDEQHATNERAWWARLGVDAWALCQFLQNAAPSIAHGERALLDYARRAREARAAVIRAGGLSAPVEAAPEPVTVTAHRTGRHESEMAQLRGKNLACWCKLDAPCHADVLLELANAPTVHRGNIGEAG